MTQHHSDLDAIQKITQDTIRKLVKTDDVAIAQYVKQVCDQMTAVGEDLKDYTLVRTVDNRDYMNMQVIYSIEKK